MILAPLEELPRYLAVHPLLPPALDWLRANPSPSPGRQAIAGEALFVNVDHGETRPRPQTRFESHRRYLDLQVVLEGGEWMEWAPVGALALEQDFAPGGDLAFYREPSFEPTRLRVLPGHFAIFFPEDAHRPLVALDGRSAGFRKLVFKLAVSG